MKKKGETSQIKNLIMSGLFWNCRGLGRPDKQRFLREMVMELGCHFIGLVETMKSDFSPLWFRNISGPRTFNWHSIPPTGRSGGLLLGVNEDAFEVLDIEAGIHFIRMLIRDKSSGKKCNLDVVYGTAQLEFKEGFLTEFAQLCNKCQEPMIIGGDFNIIRKTSEKNKPCVLPKWSFIFNSIIETSGLKELPLQGRMFTWANNLEDPTFEKLDRILVSPEWELVYPLATVSAQNRELSDHTPLFLASGLDPPHCNVFRYENCWIKREGFHELVRESWLAPTYCLHDIDKWQEKARRMRRHLKGWHFNVEGIYKRQNKELMSKLDMLDKKEETTPLIVPERTLKLDWDISLKRIMRDEELKWRQRSKEKGLKDEDANTKYFHLKASRRRKKNQISVLQNNGEEIVGDKNLVEHVTKFYKDLFGPPEVTSLRIDGVECDQIS